MATASPGQVRLRDHVPHYSRAATPWPRRSAVNIESRAQAQVRLSLSETQGRSRIAAGGLPRSGPCGALRRSGRRKRSGGSVVFPAAACSSAPGRSPIRKTARTERSGGVPNAAAALGCLFRSAEPGTPSGGLPAGLRRGVAITQSTSRAGRSGKLRPGHTAASAVQTRAARSRQG